MIELLVVIAIIALFLGLGLGAFAYIRNQAEQETAYALVTQALNAETEYKARTQRVMVDDAAALSSLLGNQAQLNAPGSTGTGAVGNMDQSIEVFTWQALSLPAAADMLRAAAGVDGLVDTDGDGFLELQDPWGNPIEFRVRNDGSETEFPRHDAPFLASSGPDGKWGSYSNSNVPDDEARDNVLSFELK